MKWNEYGKKLLVKTGECVFAYASDLTSYPLFLVLAFYKLLEVSTLFSNAEIKQLFCLN